jgi:hypothetical protein
LNHEQPGPSRAFTERTAHQLDHQN